VILQEKGLYVLSQIFVSRSLQSYLECHESRIIAIGDLVMYVLPPNCALLMFVENVKNEKFNLT